MKGTVFNIQHFTIHDGPGIRTELFMKGCSMKCRWCSNPEGIKPEIQPGIFKNRCLAKKKCGLCKKACPQTSEGAGKALSFYRGRPVIDRNICNSCMACAEACPAEAILQWGREITLEEAMKEIRRDKGYYDRSGGGVTVSGGEPLLQADFVAELFRACRSEGIHTCCESSLHVDRTRVSKILPYTDLFMADIKLMDSAKHKEFTGEGNEVILENLRKIGDYISGPGATGTELILRIPVIPGVNDNDENMKQTADFILNDLRGNVRTLQLLSFMRLGEEKYKSIDMPYEMAGIRFNRKAFQKRIEGFCEYFKKRGIHCVVGTREKE